MHKFHKSIYDAMTLIVTNDKPKDIPTKMHRYLAREGYIEVKNAYGNIDKLVYITEKGLTLLGRLEEFKHNDLSRKSTWIGLIISGVLSLFATIISLNALVRVK
ncbi:MAG: hypothetical protein AABY14_01810 [Nanoarchaeota archaeon]